MEYQIPHNPQADFDDPPPPYTREDPAAPSSSQMRVTPSRGVPSQASPSHVSTTEWTALPQETSQASLPWMTSDDVYYGENGTFPEGTIVSDWNTDAIEAYSQLETSAGPSSAFAQTPTLHAPDFQQDNSTWNPEISSEASLETPQRRYTRTVVDTEYIKVHVVKVKSDYTDVRISGRKGSESALRIKRSAWKEVMIRRGNGAIKRGHIAHQYRTYDDINSRR